MRAPPCFCNYVIKGTYLYNTYCGAQLAYPLGGSAVLTELPQDAWLTNVNADLALEFAVEGTGGVEAVSRIAA